MKSVSCHRKYAITTNFLDTMLEHSVVIEEGETKLDAYRRGLKELDQIAAELRKEYESMKGEIIHETLEGAKRTSPPIGPPMPQVIDYGKHSQHPEDILSDIKEAPSIEILTTFKLLANSDEQLRTAYMNRLKELTNGSKEV